MPSYKPRQSYTCLDVLLNSLYSILNGCYTYTNNFYYQPHPESHSAHLVLGLVSLHLACRLLQIIINKMYDLIEKISNLTYETANLGNTKTTDV